MSDCRADCRIGLVVCAVLFLAKPLSATAQTGPPTPLFPPPSSETPAQPSPLPTTAPSPAPTGIEAAPLPEIVNDTIGPLEGSAGFGWDLWRGTSRSLVEALIPQLPGTDSIAARGLARRLLLTSAKPPEGAANADLIRLRAERLLALGRAEDAAALFSLVPAARMDQTDIRRLADAHLLAGALDRACALAEQNPAFASEPAGERLQILCTLASGDRDHAFFLYDLMREQGPEDAAFAAALAIADGATGLKLPKDAPASPLLVAMLREGKAAPPDSWFRFAEPIFLPALLALPGIGEARIAAAERAARYGLVEAATLDAAYASLAVSTADRKVAANLLPDTVRRRAVLYQAAKEAAEPALRAKLIQQGLRLPVTDPIWPVSARLYAGLLRGLTPTPDLAGFAPVFARTLILAGETTSARAWVMLARANAADPGIATQLPGLALLSALAGEDDPAWTRSARQFVQGSLPTPERARLAVLAQMLIPGATSPEAAPPPGGLFDPGLGLALRNAAAARRVGETVLFALIALGDRGPGLSDPGALAEALAGLRRIGLEGEVRALAIEAAIANGG